MHTRHSNNAARRETSLVTAFLTAGLAADVMGTPVAAGQPLMEAGLDSLAAVELRSAISARLGIVLPATVALEYPNLKVRAAPLLVLTQSNCCAYYVGLASRRSTWALSPFNAC